MANPSTTGPSGAGTEVIRRSYIDGQAESEGTILTGVANHIMTIVSIIVLERGGSTDTKFKLYVDYDAGGTDLYLLDDQAIGSKKTFVWSDRFAITATDKLHIIGESADGTAALDVWCTYIDQTFA